MAVDRDASAVAGVELKVKPGQDRDEGGYLLDAESWDRSFAQATAQAEGLELGPDHWQVIEFLREYYARYQLSPPMRVLVKAIAPLLGEAKASSRRRRPPSPWRGLGARRLAWSAAVHRPARAKDGPARGRQSGCGIA